MKAEIEGIQRRSEMNVIRQRKRNQDTYKPSAQLLKFLIIFFADSLSSVASKISLEILDKIDKLQISHDELKKQIAPKKKTTAKKKKE